MLNGTAAFTPHSTHCKISVMKPQQTSLPLVKYKLLVFVHKLNNWMKSGGLGNVLGDERQQILWSVTTKVKLKWQGKNAIIMAPGGGGDVKVLVIMLSEHLTPFLFENLQQCIKKNS